MVGEKYFIYRSSMYAAGIVLATQGRKYSSSSPIGF
jgi:hypothetical protein